MPSLGVTGPTLQKFLRLDAALFVSCWWPNASCIAILYWIIWLSVWDDEIDLDENLVGRAALSAADAGVHHARAWLWGPLQGRAGFAECDYL